MRESAKPGALWQGNQVGVISTASPAEPERLARGMAELTLLGYVPRQISTLVPEGYFAGSARARGCQFMEALGREDISAVFCSRGGYGSNYIVEHLNPKNLAKPKILLGYSDITTLQIFLWQRLGWVTFYGPMVAAGFDAGAGMPGGYDQASLMSALTGSHSGWTVDLQAEALTAGEAEGVLLGGCMTLIEATLGTPWELSTEGAILLLEDRGMKAYQVDRALMHLLQAGKLKDVRGIVLGEFPDSNPPLDATLSVRDVCKRILGGLNIPVVWGAPVGHTSRPMLTIPLGVRARLRAARSGELEILEPAVTP